MQFVLTFSSLFLTALAFGQTPEQEAVPQPSWESSQRWERVVDVDGRYETESPAPFRRKADTLETALGQQIFHVAWFEVPNPATADNVIYAVSYVDYPEGSLPADSTQLIQELLLSTEEEAVTALRGELVYAAETTVGGHHPARRWRIDYRDGEASARTLALVADGRYYEIKTFSLKAQGLNKSSDRFFERFKVYTK